LQGQFICGNKKCAEREGLRSYECNFAYTDVAGGPPQAALVKIRLCPNCAYKMHYKKIKQAQRELRAKRREEKHAERKRRRTESVKAADSSSSESEADSSGDEAKVGSKLTSASTERRRTDKNTASFDFIRFYLLLIIIFADLISALFRS
jgi:protein FRA10AC1